MLVTCNHCNTRYNYIDNVPPVKCFECHKPIKVKKSQKKSQNNNKHLNQNHEFLLSKKYYYKSL